MTQASMIWQHVGHSVTKGEHGSIIVHPRNGEGLPGTYLSKKLVDEIVELASPKRSWLKRLLNIK